MSANSFSSAEAGSVPHEDMPKQGGEVTLTAPLTHRNPRNKSDLRERALLLKRARRKQKDIARELGISQQTVSRLLNGKPKLLPRKEVSFHFNLTTVLDTILQAIADGGAVGSKDIPQRVLNRLGQAGVLRKSTVPRFYVLTDEAIDKLGKGREYNYIRFCLFDVFHYDRLGGQEFETRLGQIREMWKRRTSG